jgi:hypothetical protein
MRTAALVLAAAALLFVACDDDDDGDDDDRLTSATATAPVPAAGPQNPPPPPAAPPGNSAPTLDLRVSQNVQSDGSIVLTVDMCRSSDPDRDHLNYKYLWGDGTRQYEEHAGFCAQRHVYDGATRRRVIACVDDGWWNHEVCDNFTVGGS